MKRAIFLSAIVLLVSSCQTITSYTPTGGSRADGIVRLSYEMGEFDKVQINETEANAMAAKRCATWGYTGADAFGGTTRQCNLMGGLGGCARYVVTKEYQCTGKGDATSKDN